MHTRHFFICICLAALLLATPGSAYTWSDHFTADTSGSYTGTTADLTWNTGLGWLNDSAVTAGSVYYYGGEKLGGGRYTWQVNFADHSSMHYPIFIWGSLENTDLGNPYSTGTHYELIFYDGVGTQIGKVVADVFTSLVWDPASPRSPGIYNVTVDWDPATGGILIYLNDALAYSTSDSSITNPGYMGSGQTTFDVADRDYDFWQFTNETGDSAPVAAFTCTPRAGVRNFTATLTDESTETPTSWFWWAPSTGIPCIDNTTLEVTNQNPAVFPRNFGYCGICLTATNADGSGSVCKPNYLYIAQPQAVIA